MSYQVTYNDRGKRRKSNIVYPRRLEAQGYADFLNAGSAKRGARVVKSTRKPNN